MREKGSPLWPKDWESWRECSNRDSGGEGGNDDRNCGKKLRGGII